MRSFKLIVRYLNPHSAQSWSYIVNKDTDLLYSCRPARLPTVAGAKVITVPVPAATPVKVRVASSLGIPYQSTYKSQATHGLYLQHNSVSSRVSLPSLVHVVDLFWHGVMGRMGHES
jgi:hypothetical protein